MFWDIFVKLCAEKNKKPNPVAKELGISSGAVTKWKKERVTPNSVTLHKIANYFEVTTDYLLGKTDEQTQVSSSDLSAHELKLVYAYRINPEMQQAVDTLLGVAKDDEIHIVKRAARSGLAETDSSLTTDETLLIQHGERLKPSDDV